MINPYEPNLDRIDSDEQDKPRGDAGVRPARRRRWVDDFGADQPAECATGDAGRREMFPLPLNDAGFLGCVGDDILLSHQVKMQRRVARVIG